MCTQQIPLQRRGRSRQKRGVIHVVTVGVGDQYFQEMELVRLVDYYIYIHLQCIYVYIACIYIYILTIYIYIYTYIEIYGRIFGIS